MYHLNFSTPPMNLTINPENPQWLHLYFYVFGTISLLLNMLSLYCILKKSSKEMGTYKWFLLNIWFWSFLLDCFLMIFQPVSWFPLFGGAASAKFATNWNKDMLFLLLMCIGGSLTNCTMSLVSGIFYRWQVLFRYSIFLETPKNTLTSVVTIHLSYILPGAAALVSIKPNIYRDEFIRYHVLNAEELLQYTYIVFHADIMSNATIAIVTYSFGISLVLLSCGAMLLDSYRRLFLMKENMISEKSKKMHKQMLFSLLMQAVIPMTSYATPMCLACLMVLFDFKTEHMQEQTTYMIAVFCTHSTASCIVLLTTVKCYRAAVLQLFHLERFLVRNTTIEVSRSADSDSTNRRFIHWIRSVHVDHKW